MGYTADPFCPYQFLLVDLLMKIAQQRAEESAELQVVDHSRPDGTSWYTILDEYGLDSLSMQFGENLVQLSEPTAQRAINAWVNSPGHLQTILASNKTLVGVGMAMGDDGKYYCSMILTDKD